MKYVRTTTTVKAPKGNRKEDGGIDLFVDDTFNDGKPYRLYVGEQILIPMSIKFDIPASHVLEICNKSGVSTKSGVVVGACICDHGYRGVVHVNLHKGVIGTKDMYEYNGQETEISQLTREEKRKCIHDIYTNIVPGEKIAQGILFKISDEEIEEISDEEYNTTQTTRGEGGFGSTGRK